MTIAFAYSSAHPPEHFTLETYATHMLSIPSYKRLLCGTFETIVNNGGTRLKSHFKVRTDVLRFIQGNIK